MNVMRPRIVHITRCGRTDVYIQWVLEHPAAATPARVYQIERADSQAPEAVWKTLVTNYTDSAYVDQIIATNEDIHYIMAADKRLVYRIGVREDLTSPWVYSDPVDLDGNANPEVVFVPGLGFAGREHQQMDQRPQTGKFYPNPLHDPAIMALRNRKVRNIYHGLRFGHGTEIAILKKKTHGIRCRTCYSRGAGTSLLSDCPDCYGVGWEGGYDRPALVYAKVRDSVPSDQLEPSGAVRTKSTQIGMLAFPRLANEDVIVELRNDRRWELINTPDFKVFRGISYAQECQCLELSRTHPTYRIKIESGQSWDLRQLIFTEEDPS
jgi:hypothetical protein